MLFKIIFTLVLLGQFSLAQGQFPGDWIGKYRGEMILSNTDRPSSTVNVELDLQEVEKDSVWTYTMAYHSEKFGEMTKDYRIVRVKKDDPVHYLLDEQNGIVMELSYMNDCFFGMYEVMGTIYSSTIRMKEKDQLFFELYASPMSQPKVTYAENEEGKDPIEAKSYKPRIVQSVQLDRIIEK